MRTGHVGESPHAAYDAYIRRANRRDAWWRSLGFFANLVVGVVISACLAVLTVVAVFDSLEPKIWGTFTYERCEPKPVTGCRVMGTWVSDDGSIVKHDVYLDGWLFGDSRVPASYRPTGIISDAANDTVHVPLLSDAGPWLTGAVFLGWTGLVIHRSFGDRLFRRPAGPPLPPGPGSRRSRRLLAKQ